MFESFNLFFMFMRGTNIAIYTIDIYTRNTWETWDNVFNLIKEDIIKLNKNWSSK